MARWHAGAHVAPPSESTPGDVPPPVTKSQDGGQAFLPQIANDYRPINFRFSLAKKYSPIIFSKNVSTNNIAPKKNKT